MIDGCGRVINYARVSLTDLCNLRCRYCMSEDGVQKKSHDEILSLEKSEEIIDALIRLGVNKIRFTGGEPLVRRGAVELIERLAKKSSAALALTTNGVLLPRYAARLKAAGVEKINVSIDSLNANRYEEITRGGKLKDALDGLDSVLAAGIKNVKVNAVLLRGVNDDELLNFARFGKEKGVEVRFIELMPFGCQQEYAAERYVSSDETLLAYPQFKKINSGNLLGDENGAEYENNAFGKNECGVTNNCVYYGTADGFRVGFISPLSHKFCDKCNRVRITADGKLLNCLHQCEEYDLKPYLNDGEALKNYILECVSKKPREHHLDDGCLQKRNMNGIGG